MSDRIPVFDNLGNKVGDFVPEGSGLLTGCGVVLAILFIMVVLEICVYIVEGFSYLIKKGRSALKDRKIVSAVVYLSVPVLSVLIPLGLLGYYLVNSAITQVNNAIELEADKVETINSVKALSITGKKEGNRWVLLVDIESGGKYRVSIEYLSDSPISSIPRYRGCYATNNGQLSSFVVTGSIYRCSFPVPYEKIYGEGIYAGVKVYNESGGEIGEGWKKLN